MEQQAIPQTSRRSKLNWIFRMIGAILRLAAFLTMLGAWVSAFAAASINFVYVALAATVLYILLFALTIVLSRRFRQGIRDGKPASYVFDGVPLCLAYLSLVLGFLYDYSQIATSIGMLPSIGMLFGIIFLLNGAFYIGDLLDKGHSDATALLDGCGEGCAEGCIGMFLDGLHI